MSEHVISLEDASKDLLACAAYVAQDIHNHEAHAAAMRAVVPHYLAKGEVDIAAELANTVEDPFGRDKLLTMVAEECAAAGDDDYALQLADAIEDIGQRSVALEKIASSYSAGGQLDKAKRIAEELAHPEYVYAELALKYAAASDDAEASEMLRMIEFPNAKVSALIAIAQLEFGRGSPEKALASLNAAADEAGEIEHDEERLRALVDIGNLLVQTGHAGDAVSIFESVRDQAERLSTHRDYCLSTAAVGQLIAGDADGADATLELMRDKTHASSTLLGFAKEYRKRGDAEAARDELEESLAILRSQKDSEVRDSRALYALQRLIAVEYAESNSLERSLEVAQQIVDPSEKTTALQHIAQTLVVKGEGERVNNVIEAIEADADRLYAWVGVAVKFFEKGEKGRALSSLQRAFPLLETIPNLSQRVIAASELARRFVEFGETEKGLEVSRESLSLASGITLAGQQAIAHANLSAVYSDTEFQMRERELEILSSILRRGQF
jgi:tetratricopeptide (TPR) repeat protein